MIWERKLLDVWLITFECCKKEIQGILWVGKISAQNRLHQTQGENELEVDVPII